MPISHAQLSVIANADAVQRYVMAFTTAPYTTTNNFADVPGSDFDALLVDTLAITMTNITNTITYQILGANLADFSDAVVVATPSGTAGTADIAAAATGNFATYFLAFRYYKVQAKAKVNGSQGVVTVNVFARPTS